MMQKLRVIYEAWSDRPFKVQHDKFVHVEKFKRNALVVELMIFRGLLKSTTERLEAIKS
jgi:hypothetical protein